MFNKNNNYDQNASTYAKLQPQGEGTIFLSFRDIEPLIKKYNATLSTNSCLDYGCGAGRSTRHLKKLGFTNIQSYDVNQEMLKQAIVVDPHGNYQLIESAKLPVKNDTYDFALMTFVTVEISSTVEITNIFREIKRVLKPNGIFICLHLSDNFFDPKKQWLSYFQDYPENYNPKSGQKSRLKITSIDLDLSDYYWTDEDIKECVLNAALHLEEIHYPLGKKTDHIDWLEEWDSSPYSLFVCRK